MSCTPNAIHPIAKSFRLSPFLSELTAFSNRYYKERNYTYGAISKAFELLGAFVEAMIEIAEQSRKSGKTPNK